MRLRIKFVLVLILLCSSVFSVKHINSQQSNSVLFLLQKGDLFSWSGKGTDLITRTTWGYNQNPIVSPNGQMIAYKSTAQEAVNVIKKSGPLSGGDIPANIWVMTIASGDAQRVAKQPDDFAFFTQGKGEKYILRSTPVWSPDSKALAWSQLVVESKGGTDASEQGTVQVVVYDLESKQETVIVKALPSQYGIPSAVPLAWGESGIAVWSIPVPTDSSNTGATADANNPASNTTPSSDTILFYDPNGKLINTVKVESLIEFSWIKNGSTELLATLSKGPASQPLNAVQWLLIDPGTGRMFGMPGVPELYSLSAPDGASVTLASMNAAPTWNVTAGTRTLASLGAVDDVYAFTHAIAISSDGQQVAYVQDGSLYIFTANKNDKPLKLVPSDASAVAWGPIGWRVKRQAGH